MKNPTRKCCCGKYNLFEFETRASYNETTHETLGSRPDAFCGPHKDHAMRDLQDEIDALTKERAEEEKRKDFAYTRICEVEAERDELAKKLNDNLILQGRKEIHMSERAETAEAKVKELEGDVFREGVSCAKPLTLSKPWR